MTIAGEGKNPAFEHIRLVGEEFQIREKDVIEITEKVMEALENWKEFAREAGIPEPVSDRIQGRFISVKKPPKARY